MGVAGKVWMLLDEERSRVGPEEMRRTLVLHPEDRVELQGQLDAYEDEPGVEGWETEHGVVELREDATLARGEVRLV